MTETARPSICLLAAPETSPSVLYGLYDVLYSVGAVWPDMTTGRPGTAALDVRIVAAEGTPFRCFGNVLVEPHAALDQVDAADVIIVCDLYTPIDTPPRGRYPREVAWIRRMHADGALIGSACSGSLLLAEAGLLDGRVCTGHWAYGELFRDAYPGIEFDTSAVLVLDTEADGVITAGGVTAWQDLALHVIARLCGREAALQTAKVHLLAGHEHGQGPFAAMVRRPVGADGAIERSVAWLATNYPLANPVALMAEHVGLTARTFGRRFRAATGRRPIDYVHAVRIDAAKRRIESGAEAIDAVGFDVGYEDPTFFRRLFKRETGLTPTAYRRMYAAIAPEPDAARPGS